MEQEWEQANGHTTRSMNVLQKGITGSTLKMIAIIAMLVDHIGAVILERILVNSGMPVVMSGDSSDMILQFFAENMELTLLWLVMRMVIGRLGFPIFCFLLVEGFGHTHNIWKYASRLLLFAFLSEVPFDLAIYGMPVYMGYQNVFFTLLVGLLVMIAYRKIAEKFEGQQFVRIFLYALALLAGMIVAGVLKSDYGAIGVVCIMVLYMFRYNKAHQMIAGCVVFLWEVTAPLAFIPIAFYNRQRGLRMKYFFYIFYPAHLLILYLIARFCGIV